MPFVITSRSFLLRMRNVSDKSCRVIKTDILCSVAVFFENRVVYEIMWKNIVERVGHTWQYGACALHAGCLRLQIHWGCVTLTAFPLHKNGYTNAPQFYVIRTFPVLFVPFLSIRTKFLQSALTLNIPSLARQRCLSSWGPRRTPWFFFCNFSTVCCGRLLKLCFLGFWNYNSVIQALLASNILCLFISTEVSQ